MRLPLGSSERQRTNPLATAMRAFSFALAILFTLIGAPMPVTGHAGAQSSEDLDAFNRQVQQLYRAGKHTEALPIAEQYVAAARKRHGEEHTAYAEAISWLAVLLRATNRLAEAEPLMRRALAIEETVSYTHLTLPTTERV